MEFKSQICTTKEQSERLLALGLKKETADMSISTSSLDTDNGIKFSLTPYTECKFRIMYNVIPAWSLHRLIEILDIWYLDLDFHNFANAYEQVISYFEERVKGGFINKEYLEE